MGHPYAGQSQERSPNESARDSGIGCKAWVRDTNFCCRLQPTLDRNFLESLIGRHPIHLVTDALPALAYSRAGIIASGTATVEAAMMGTPFVMVYRVSPLTYLLGRSRVKVPHFAMVNLIAGKEIVPELVQHDFTSEKVVARLSEILQDGPARERMIEGLAEVRTLLRGPSLDRPIRQSGLRRRIMALLPKPLART